MAPKNPGFEAAVQRALAAERRAPGAVIPVTLPELKASPSPVIARGRKPEAVYRSQLEADYADLLEARRLAGEIVAWCYEGVSFNLGGGAKYRPDFMVVERDLALTLEETKGFRREAAIVRIKVAAAKFPWLRFVMVTRDKDGWHEAEI